MGINDIFKTNQIALFWALKRIFLESVRLDTVNQINSLYYNVININNLL